MASSSAPATSSEPSKQTLRLQRDLKDLTDNPLDFVSNLMLSVVDNANQLSGVMIGPNNSPYAGGHFRFIINFPPEYPFTLPDFNFVTAICHPNVHSGTGTACNDQLIATWNPRVTLRHLLTEMHLLLANPNYENPVEGDTVPEKDPTKARQWTENFAQPN